MRRDNLKLAERKEQMDKSNSQRDSQIKVVIDWDYAGEPSPAFKRLMMLLLKPRDSQLVETATTNEEHQNEQC